MGSRTADWQGNVPKSREEPHHGPLHRKVLQHYCTAAQYCRSTTPIGLPIWDGCAGGQPLMAACRSPGIHPSHPLATCAAGPLQTPGRRLCLCCPPPSTSYRRAARAHLRWVRLAISPCSHAAGLWAGAYCLECALLCSILHPSKPPHLPCPNPPHTPLQGMASTEEIEGTGQGGARNEKHGSTYTGGYGLSVESAEGQGSGSVAACEAGRGWLWASATPCQPPAAHRTRVTVTPPAS